MITLKQLLKESVLSDLSLLAGNAGLDNAVRAVSIMDAPDSHKWLKGGEFILTTAFLFGGDEKLLEHFIMNLIEAGSGCLGIKKGRFLNKVPENVALLADQKQFPIIEIPYRFGWSV